MTLRAVRELRLAADYDIQSADSSVETISDTSDRGRKITRSRSGLRECLYRALWRPHLDIVDWRRLAGLKPDGFAPVQERFG